MTGWIVAGVLYGLAAADAWEEADLLDAPIWGKILFASMWPFAAVIRLVMRIVEMVMP